VPIDAGMLDGAVFLWKAGIRPSVLRVLPAQHDGAVLSICVSAGLVVTGGADGMVKVWSVEGKVEEGTNEHAGDKKDGKEGKKGKTEVPLGRTGYGGGISSEGESGEENESGNRAPDKVMDIAKMLQEGAHSPFLHSDGGLAAVQCLHVKHTRISDGDGERYGSGWSFVMSTKGREVVEVTLEDLNPSTVGDAPLFHSIAILSYSPFIGSNPTFQAVMHVFQMFNWIQMWD
jgi:WD40 repeat protein